MSRSIRCLDMIAIAAVILTGCDSPEREVAGITKELESGDVSAVYRLDEMSRNRNEYAKQSRRPALVALAKGLTHSDASIRAATAWCFRKRLGDEGVGSGKEWVQKLRDDTEVFPAFEAAAEDPNTFVHAALSPFLGRTADTGINIFIESEHQEINSENDRTSELATVTKARVFADAGYQLVTSAEETDLILTENHRSNSEEPANYLWDAKADRLLIQFDGPWWFECKDVDRAFMAIPRFGVSRTEYGFQSLSLSTFHHDAVRPRGNGYSNMTVLLRDPVRDGQYSDAERALLGLLMTNGIDVVRKEENANVLLYCDSETTSFRYTNGAPGFSFSFKVRFHPKHSPRRSIEFAFSGRDPSIQGEVANGTTLAALALLKDVEQKSGTLVEAVRNSAAN